MASTPKNEPIIVQVDLGNSDFNLILCNPDGLTQEFLMPHDYLRLNETEWNQRVSRAKVQKSRVDASQTFSIKVDGEMVPVMIGEEARISPDSHKQIGSNKYEYGYMDALLCAALLEMFPANQYPKGHDNIILGIGFPTTEVDHLQRLVDIVGKAHYIQDLNGNKRKFVVRQVIPTDEALGGLLRYKKLRGGMNFFDLDPGQQILWIDIGGSIGSMGIVTMNKDRNLVPLYREVKPINQGILDTFDQLKGTLKYHHPNEFRGMDIPFHMLKTALLTQKITLSGSTTPIDVTQAVKDACSILDEIDRIYKSKQFGGGRAFNGVVMTGGGTGALFKLVETVLNHNRALPADELDSINYANVRGGLEATLAALIDDGILPDNYKASYYAS